MPKTKTLIKPKTSNSKPFTRFYRFVRHPEEKRQLLELYESLSGYLDDAAIAEVGHAYEVGAAAHEGQHRIAGEKYINHPLAVARLLAELELASSIIVAAILHDTLEDTQLSKLDLADQFGSEVANLVEGVSKVDNVETMTRQQAEVENIRRMILAMSSDGRVILIKLADRLHNMRTLEALRSDKQRRIARQTMDIYVPIADLVGMFNWRRELEDLCFKYLYPNRYRVIRRAVKQGLGSSNDLITRQIKSMRKLFKAWDIEASVFGREKNLYALYRKMKRKNNRLALVQDVFGFRVIVSSLADCYKALGAIHSRYKPISSEFTDYIAIPKMNGYQSLHTTVYGEFGRTLEIQIRTEQMNDAAETGIASHMQYKDAERISTKRSNKIPGSEWLVDLLKMLDADDSPSEALDKIKLSLYPDEVYVFTPDSEIKRLPKGSTVIDFAYAVHSKVGDDANSALINGEPVPLHALLSNGDCVEIIRRKKMNSIPDAAWLDFAVTGKARTSIRDSIKKTSRMQREKVGDKLLKLALKALKFKFRDISQTMKDELMREFGSVSWEDVLDDIGSGRRNASMVARQLISAEHHSQNLEVPSLAVYGTEGLAITYAKCCNPIPNEAIVGLFTRGRGIVIHAEECINVARSNYAPSLWSKVHWADSPQGVFSVPLRLDTDDRKGMLAKVSSIIATQEANISDCKMTPRGKDIVTMDFTIEVLHGAHLARIMKQLKREAAVHRVSRPRTI